MFATMRALALALIPALAGCTCDTRSKTAAGAGSARVEAVSEPPAARSVGVGGGGGWAGSAGPAAASACNTETAIRVSRVLTDPTHPCRARILAAYGRLVHLGTGVGSSSGTLVSTAAARGAGVLVTCRPCAGAAGGDRG